MRFMLMSKVKPDAPMQPTPALMEKMGKFIENAQKKGILVGTGGLMPMEAGARVLLSGGKITVTDGPFVEVKEMIGGYGIVEVASKEEAIAVSREFLQIHLDVFGPDFEMDSEVRQMYVG